MDTWKQWLVLSLFFDELLDPGVDQPLSRIPLTHLAGGVTLSLGLLISASASAASVELVEGGFKPDGSYAKPSYRLTEGDNAQIPAGMILNTETGLFERARHPAQAQDGASTPKQSVFPKGLSRPGSRFD